MAEHKLTTVDNPYDPFTEWDQWYEFDERSGYQTTGLLARIIVFSSEMSESQMDQAIEDAIEEIVDENVSGMHRRVQAGEMSKG